VGKPVVPEPRSAYALQFFFVAASLVAISLAMSMALVKIFPIDQGTRPNRFSPAFGVSTCLLFAGSGCLTQAVQSVRRERQRSFRRWLFLGLAAGALFVATQTYALSCLIRRQTADEDSSGAAVFVVVFAAMHAMHFVIALLFLSHVTVQAMADRYDHEYYWGVRALAWFWHVLGIAWLMILFVMFIARYYSV
jgi:cytochrome c oxidase subunit 3